uniref:SH3 domain-containing protein n=1 Tax=Ananas comosus var. bracteatus TaxID=296719 RepID=A0A6V7NSC7_ANACO|nr:unnamed protein product [Ananas comosus var. bracteatus]
MDAIRKQATKLREQVAKQQQAVLKQFANGGYASFDYVFSDEAELQQHQKLEKLYISTRSGKHFQRDIVRGVEGYKSQDPNKLNSAQNYQKIARNGKGTWGLIESSQHPGRRAIKSNGSNYPLEDARHLAQRYDEMRQEAEAQAIEVSKRQIKGREDAGNIDNNLKLETAESKLQDLKSNMTVLGKEAIVAMTVVEAQQQRLTLQRLIAMMVSERQRIEATPSPVIEDPVPPPPSYEDANGIYSSQTVNGSGDSVGYFQAEVVHAYQAESDVELELSVGDFVVVRKVVASDGWAEGECKGKAGWFPYGYVERRDRVPATKIAEVF